MDDTFVIQKEDHKQNFIEPINCLVPAIRFTVKDNREDGAIPCLDTIVKPEIDWRLLSLYIENPPSQTNISSGIVTIIFQPSTV